MRYVNGGVLKHAIMLGLSAAANPDSAERQKMWEIIGNYVFPRVGGTPDWVYAEGPGPELQSYPYEYEEHGESGKMRFNFPMYDQTLEEAKEYWRDFFNIGYHSCAVMNAGGDCCGHWIPNWVSIWTGGDGVGYGILHSSMNV